MRTLDEHKTNPANDQLTVRVLDEPGAGGANHDYEITKPSTGKADGLYFRIVFQNGPIAEAGVNGLTHEVLLAILSDRLRSFQVGPYACAENYNALYHVERALWWLKQRTEKRLARGVEGTHTP